MMHTQLTSYIHLFYEINYIIIRIYKFYSMKYIIFISNKSKFAHKYINLINIS